MMKHMKMTSGVPLVLVSVLLVFATASWSYAQRADTPKNMVIVGPRAATSTFVFATGIAEMINKYVGIKTVPEPGTMGRNVLLVHKKEVEFGLTNNDRAYFGVRGEDEYKSFGKMNVRLMFSTTNSVPFCFVTRRDANIRSTADLNGKRVMCLYPGNPAFTKGADIHFEAAGMSRKDVQAISFTGHADGNMALKERRVSAYIHPITITSVSPFLQEMNMDVPIRLVGSPKEKLSAALRKYPYFREDTVPAKIYGDMVDQRDLPSIGVLEILICQAELSEELIYKVMKAIFEHVPELTLMTPIAKYWTAGPTSSAILPYHSGAIKYYKEKNLWTEELERKQKELLVEVGISK